MMEKEYKKYDVVLVDFGKEILGGEQAGVRPAIIIQNDIGNNFSQTTIVMPVTSKIKKLNQPTHALLLRNKDNGLSEDSMILGECMRQISKKRILKHIGTIYDIEDREKIKRIYFANWEVA